MLSTRVGVSYRDNKGPPEYPRCQNTNSGIILPDLAAVIYEAGRRSYQQSQSNLPPSLSRLFMPR